MINWLPLQQFSIKVTKKMNINKNVQGHLFALTANVMWGLMAPIGKFALQEFSALSVTTFRMVGAAAAFWILSMFCKQEHVNHKDMLKIFFASLFALVFNQAEVCQRIRCAGSAAISAAWSAMAFSISAARQRLVRA